ncbi:phosphoribosylformylglycinamidine synthase subunit PurQ [bacterium]|nr:phosphoribosylformylglycinamidine synthase subunit PurQ [bacterium]MBU1653114.1 phosphoribosylformylglycinamidine synthase subunit PurQ [bacterium]
MRFGIVVFPGSNCDHDCYWGLKHDLAYEVNFLWHRQKDLVGSDCIILPGGFAHGDYLRAGAIARFSPIMEEVVKHAHNGKPVIGICNGFQVLTEIGLLPGALLKNNTLSFIHKPVTLRIEHRDSLFTRSYKTNAVIELPIAHGQGRYYASDEVIAELQSENRILFRYSSPKGELSSAWNPNGSLLDIAGICNAAGNIMGMMPHPERRMNQQLGGVDGRAIFQGVAQAFA